MKLIYIEWEDACSNAAWMDPDRLEQWIRDSQWICKQVGWVYEETRQHIVLIGRIDDDPQTGSTYGQVQRIPKTWIRKRIDLSSCVPIIKKPPVKKQ